jgi:outer membrane receptor protein involved in Fe transport
MSKKFNWGRALLSGASIAAMGAMANPALAQDEDVSEEIVVTATGRTAAIQDVPLAVQAINNETLEQSGVQSLADLNQLAPTLRIGSGQSTTSGTGVAIRGVGTGSDNPGFEGAVGIFIDGVYRSRAGAALADLPDVQRIEILRGPQGTLFGKNTSAGAISVVTAAPSGAVGAWGEIEGANYDGLRTSFGAEAPLSDSLAIRFDGAIRGADGYITDVTSNRDINDRDRWTARLQALWDINDAASLRLIVDGGQTDENCCGAVNIQSGDIVGLLGDIYFPGAILPEDQQQERNMTVTPNRSYSEQADDFGVSGELNWDIGGVRLTSITSYRDWSAVRDQDIDFTSLDRAYRDGLEIDISNASQEIRLQGEWGRVNWLVGGFYSREELETTDRIRFGEDAMLFANAATFFLTGGTKKLYDLPVQTFDPVTFLPTGFTDVQVCTATPAAPICTGAARTQTGALLGLNVDADPEQEINRYLPGLNSGDGQQADNWNTTTESMSLFTHNEISLSDNLVLTLGARYNQETKELSAALNSQNAACNYLQTQTVTVDPLGALPNANYNLASLISLGSGGAADVPFAFACNAVTNTLANGDWSDDREENEWSGTASLAYHMSDDLMIYGGYSRGYKAGGFNLDRSGFFGTDNLPPFAGQFGAFGVGPGTNVNAYEFADLNPALPQASVALTTDSLEFEPEFTDAYEVGFKSTIFGGTTFFNANVFYQQIHDYQTNAFSGTNFFTLNVEELISQGVEVELNSRVTENLTLMGGVLYNEAYYNADATYGGETILTDTPLTQAPEWTVTGAVNYAMPIGNGLGFNFFLNGRYVTDYRTMTLGRNPLTDNDAFATFDARISFGAEDRSWSAELFAQNLTDEFYYIAGFSAPERASTAIGIENGNYLAYPNRPRVIGLTLRARY